MKITLELTDEQQDALADAVAARLAKMGAPKKPYTVAEFAEATRQTPATIYAHIKAGNIPTVPGIHKKLIPAKQLNNYI